MFFNFGGGKKQRQLKALEGYIEDLQTSVEEAEVTIAAKDDIIRLMLEDRAQQEQEMARLEERILIALNKLKIEEKRYQKATNIKGRKGSSVGALFSPKRKSISSAFGFKPRRGSRFTKDLPKPTGEFLNPKGVNEIAGKLCIVCSAVNIPAKNLCLKVRQGGITLPGAKTKHVKPQANREGKARNLFKWAPLYILIADFDKRLPLHIELWKKGAMRIRSKAVAVAKVIFADLLQIFRSNQSADLDLFGPRDHKAFITSSPRNTNDMNEEETEELNGSPNSNKSKGWSPSRGTKYGKDKMKENMKLTLHSVSVQAPSRGVSRLKKPQPGEEKSLLNGVTMRDLTGRWTNLGGAYFYVTKKGRVLDSYKHQFGILSIAADKEEYDVGMVNHDEGGAFSFATLEKGRLKWSNDETWMGRNRNLVVFDDEDDDTPRRYARTNHARGVA
mmetsp:Transcript_4296/g.10079  ORF Transcript_4296/g.10079 Transcript_4296/m.10079 type:complete len:445 (+) Transcript_4296:81-1415(+)